MYKWTKKTPGSRRRSRGSVLVIVVAVLMMIALIGTAYIATARLDRYAAQQQVRLVQSEQTREAYADYVAGLVRRTIGEDFQNNVTGPRTVPWLADRLPRALVIRSNRVPAWRYITGHLYRSIDRSLRVYEPPMLNGNTVGACDGLIKVIDYGSTFFSSVVGSDRYWAVPTSITLRYPSASDPNPYPVEKYRGKVRTFPAMQFWNPNDNPPHYMPSNGKPDIYLAADADGDGIADSVLVRIAPAPVEGVTYYAAVRIIDNSSAINVNTAWSRDRTYDQAGIVQNATGTPPNQVSRSIKTFFPSNIGLRELFDGQTMADGGLIMWAINRHRFGGYARDQLESVEKSGSADLRVLSSGVMYNDQPAQLGSYTSDSLGEQMSIQLGRRLENPGWYADTRSGHNDKYRYQAFPETDAAALAYRFCMLRWESELDNNNHLKPVLGELSRTVDKWGRGTSSNSIDALIEPAPNYAQDARNRFTCFPANEMRTWFQWLDYDENNTNLRFTESPTNVIRLRPVQPLLTTHNAVTSRAKVRTTVYRWPVVYNPAVAGYPLGLNPLLYPGMLSGKVFDDHPKGVQPYRRAGYRYGEMVQVTGNNTGSPMTFMCINGGSPTTPMVDNRLNPITWEPQPYVSGKNKASINNAGFPELWRAFYQVMAESRDAALLPSDASWSPVESEWNNLKGLPATDAKVNPYYGMTFGTAHPFDPIGAENWLRMFRSPIRDPRTAVSVNNAQTPSVPFHRLTPVQVMALRSALAAVNTMALRDQNNLAKVPMRKITLYDVRSPTSPSPSYDVTVYGHRPQPFIAEVYANSDTYKYGTHKNSYGYVAIKLYNPYPDPIDLSNWQLATMERGSSFGGSNTLQRLHTIPWNRNPLKRTYINRHDYLLLESYPSPTDAGLQAYRPLSSGIKNLTGDIPPANGIISVYKVPQLSDSAGTVFNKEIIILRPVDPPTTAALPPETMVPVDQFDFTGLTLSPSAAATWHYARETNGSNVGWDFVYPGRYDASPGVVRRHQGTKVSEQDTYTPSSGDPWNPQQLLDPNPTNGDFPWGTAGVPNDMTLTKASSSKTYPTAFRIQLPYRDVPSAIPKAMYPYGGFARNGDILQVPFIGAYTIRWRSTTGNKIIEMNSISMDSAFAEDAYTGNDTDEQVGRFCPISHITNTWTAYDWAGRLFEYLDVHVPAEEFLPNANWWTVVSNTKQAVPSAEGTGVADAYVGKNDRVGVQGRININTAPRRGLQMLPMVPNTDGSINATENARLARAIVDYRETLGPPANPNQEFKTIFDLNKVNVMYSLPDPDPVGAVAFVTGRGKINATTGTPTWDVGDVSPGTVAGDFKARYLMLNRISNLVTTRSDTFTCYILVQGWREAGTNLPSLDWEQRKAFILDRSGGPDHLKMIPVPTD